jgi:hypothetical protein
MRPPLRLRRFRRTESTAENFGAERHGTCISKAQPLGWRATVGELSGETNDFNMKPFIALLSSSLLLCSCADMYVTNATVGGTGRAGSIDTKDFSSAGIHMLSCGVGAHDPKAIYIRPFCIDSATVVGDVAHSDGELPIRKALIPVSFATTLKEQLEKIAPARVLTGSIAYEFDVYGGSGLQGRAGTLRAAGLGKGAEFDLVNAAERIYLALEPNAFRYGIRANVALQ